MSHLIFALTAPVALVALAGVALLGWRERAVPGTPALGLMAAVGALWILFSLLAQLMPTFESSVAVGRLMMACAAWMGICWFTFVAQATGLDRWTRSPLFYLLCFLALVTTALSVSVPHHDLLISDLAPREVGYGFTGYSVGVIGPWFWVHAAIGWSLVIAGVVRVVRLFLRPQGPQQRLSPWLVVGAVVPLAFNFAFYLGLLPFEKNFSPLWFALGCLAYAQGTFSYRLLNLRHRARLQYADEMSDALIAIDAYGRVSDLNAEARAIAGPSNAMGRPLAEALPSLSAACVLPRGEINCRIAGQDRTFAWQADPIRCHEARSIGRLIVMRDVTENRVTEAYLRHTLGELERRNTDLDAFSRMVAHDLKNPIGGIMGYAQLMQMDGDELTSELRDEAVSTILSVSEEMVSIIDEMLVLSSVGTETVIPVPLEMERVARNALQRVETILQKSEAQIEISDVWPKAFGHAPWVTAIWANYLSNAAKYGGRPARVRLGSERRGDAVRFWVDDNGPGVPPEKRAAVFGAFERLHGDEIAGHGVGLSIVTRITDRIGGSCGVGDAPGGGSRFWFELPAAPALEDVITLTPGSNVAEGQSKSVVLQTLSLAA